MASINGYEIDAIVTEDHSFDSDVTDLPVETGADITDNARAKPIMISLDCVVSDTPIGRMVDVRNTETADDDAELQFLPSDDAYYRMIAIRNAREPVTLETSLGVFPNMMMTSMVVPRNAQNGEALRFRVTFKEIRLVTNARTTVKVAVPRAAKRVNRGSVPASDVVAPAAAKADEDASVLAEILPDSWSTR